MVEPRIPIPEEVRAQVLFASDHTCCVCNAPGLAIQIHHIDGNRSNNAIENLSVLCLEHHNCTQITGGFGAKLGPKEVTLYRDAWLIRVIERRKRANELAAISLAIPALPTSEVAPVEWEPLSRDTLHAYLRGLPALRRGLLEAARPRWDSGISSEMRQACYDVIDVFERVWIRLASWYPPNHFGGRPAAEYISTFVASRFEWHRALYNPQGEGSGGHIVGEIAAGAVMDDAADAISEIVQALLVQDVYPEVQNWVSEWDAVARNNS